MKLLLEMRPALDSFAGIPQVTRLLFRGLSLIESLEVEGLILSSGRVLARGLPTRPGLLRKRLSVDRKINKLSRVIISLQQNLHQVFLDKTGIDIDGITAAVGMVLSRFIGTGQELTEFDPTHFRDFIWRNFFAKTLPFSDFESVTRAKFRIARTPWTMMHMCGLISRKFGYAFYPRLDTGDFNILIAQTPFPGTVSARTQLVVHYHDAVPLLMPHTISDKTFHQASHYHALKNNVRNGAFFACVSAATRTDLLSIFPEAAPRAVILHNMVSHHYFPEDSSPLRVPEIVRTRIQGDAKVRAFKRNEKANITGPEAKRGAFEYLLIVSTIEPRKNHATLVAAWEQLRTERFPDLKLIMVGMRGWDHETIMKKFKTWRERGELFVLENLPSPELRLLYKHARATVCPSFAEGFDFSGVEAMRSGGAVAASDIPVHREVYDDAAEYFSPYSALEMADAISRVIDPAQSLRRQELIELGANISAQYLPEKILPKWKDFLERLRSQAGAG